VKCQVSEIFLDVAVRYRRDREGRGDLCLIEAVVLSVISRRKNRMLAPGTKTIRLIVYLGIAKL
jgi:hypothetical protein